MNNPAQANNIVPFSQFAIDLANNQLPNYSFIIPEPAQQLARLSAGDPELHECRQADGRGSVAEDNIDPLIASAAFRQNGLLILTDESVDATRRMAAGTSSQS